MDLFDKIYEKYGEPVLPLQAYAYNNAAAPLQIIRGPLPFNPLPPERQKHFTSPNSINSALGVGVAGGSMGSLVPSKSPSVSLNVDNLLFSINYRIIPIRVHTNTADHSGKVIASFLCAMCSHSTIFRYVYTAELSGVNEWCRVVVAGERCANCWSWHTRGGSCRFQVRRANCFETRIHGKYKPRDKHYICGCF